MVYIALKQNKIVHVCETQSEENVIASMNYEGITDYDSIKQIPDDYFQGKVGNDIREFNGNYELLPMSERKEYATIPEGFKIEGEEFVPMTLKERIDAGFITPSDYEIWDEELEQLRGKTLDELVADGLMTKEERFEIKLQQCFSNRKAAYANESDGLFFDYQRGEIEKSVWENKVKEIKTRYPKPAK